MNSMNRLMALVIAGAIAVVLLALPVAASAAGRVYWTDNTMQLPFAALDGSGGGLLPLSGGTTSYPRGVAIDSAANKIYWVGESGVVSFANLDGSGRGNLNTAGATFSSPSGAAIDPVSRRIYWANFNSIAYANLDGSGGGTLNTGGAPVFAAQDIAVEPATGRAYWAAISGNEIAYANLDGSGGGTLDTSGAVVDGPDGVAVDPVAKRLYWSNDEGSSPISYANLDGSGGGGNLNVTGGNTLHPRGVAIDPEARRVYWAEEESPGSISYADLGGSGGGVLPTAGASVQYAHFPILQDPPHAVSAPLLSGTAAIGATLNCSQGSWAGDQTGSQLYRAPSSFSYQWLRGGTEVAGAATASYGPAAGGSYSCRVTATNAAGSTVQTSAALEVPGAPLKKTHGTATAAGQAKVKKGVVRLRTHCPAKGGECRGAVKLVARGKHHVLGKQRFRIAPGKAKLIRIKLSGVGLEMLREASQHRLRVNLVGGGVKHHSLLLRLVP